MLSALVVPAFAKLGDMVGHKRMLLISTAVTAAAALVLPFTDSFPVFLAAWALMGFYVVWLPLEIALIWSRSRRMEGVPRSRRRQRASSSRRSKEVRSSARSWVARSSMSCRSPWCCWCLPC